MPSTKNKTKQNKKGVSPQKRGLNKQLWGYRDGQYNVTFLGKIDMQLFVGKLYYKKKAMEEKEARIVVRL